MHLDINTFMYNEEQQKFLSCVTVFIIAFLLFMCFIMFSCTYNVSVVHSEGTATDVIDSNQTPTSNLETQLSLSQI